MNRDLTLALWVFNISAMLCEKTHTQLPLAGLVDWLVGDPSPALSGEPQSEMASSGDDREKPYWQKYYAKNRERLRAYHRARYHGNKERHKKNVDRWQQKNREHVLEHNRIKQRERIARLSPEQNKERIRRSNQRARELHPDQDKERYRRDYADPEKRKKILADCKEYRKANRKKITAYQVKWIMNKRRTDPHFRMIQDLRIRARAALKGGLKQESTTQLLGCDKDTAIRFIEGQFKPGMTWDNHGRKAGCWVVDHRVPIAAHDLTTEEGRRAAFRYTNLQPLWFEENLEKSSWHNGRLWTRHDHKPSCPPAPESAQSAV